MFSKKIENPFIGVGHNSLTADCRVKGEIEASTDIRIDGEWIGNISCAGKVIIGTSGSVTGNILAENADIMGKLTGNIDVKKTLVLKSSAILQGNISTGFIAIEANAQFNGRCEMSLR